MSIVQIFIDEREKRIRIQRHGIGETAYPLTDRRIGSIISALIEIGDASPITHWLFESSGSAGRIQPLPRYVGVPDYAIRVPIHDHLETE